MDRYHINARLLIVLLLIVLTGCNPDSELPNYEIEYSSGNIITNITDLSKPFPIEATELQIYTDHIKGSEYRMNIQNAAGEILYTSEDAESRNRGYSVNEELWICGESWSSVHRSQFVDNTMEHGRIYQLDMNSGEIIYEKDLEKNEFFLTINDGRFYFYHRGTEGEEKIFGLVTTSSQSAGIYYRDSTDWETKHMVHTFDYAGMPLEARENGNFTLYFSVQTDEITVDLNSYEKTIDGEWGNVSIWSVDIPLS